MSECFVSNSGDGRLIPETFITTVSDGMGSFVKYLNFRYNIMDFKENVPYSVYVYFATVEGSWLEQAWVVFVIRQGSTLTVTMQNFYWDSSSNLWAFKNSSGTSFYGTQENNTIIWKVGFSQAYGVATPKGECWAKPLSK